MQTVVVAVRLTPKLLATLGEFCTLSGRTPSEVLRALLSTAELSSLPHSWTALTPTERAILTEIEHRPGPRPLILTPLHSGIESAMPAIESGNV
jgi:hypothetical protein